MKAAVHALNAYFISGLCTFRGLKNHQSHTARGIGLAVHYLKAGISEAQV